MRRLTSYSIILLAVCSAAPAAAQAPQRSAAVQLFEPAIGPETFFTVETSRVVRHLGFLGGVVFNYQHKPLSLFVREGGTGTFDLGQSFEIPIVRNNLTANVFGAFGLSYKWLKLQIGLGLPINLYLRGNTVDENGKASGDLAGEGLGDLRLQIKANLLDEWKGLSIAISPVITFPTGCLVAGGLGKCDQNGSFSGDSNLTVRPRATVDWRYKRFIIAANVGWLFRLDDAVLYSTEISDRLIYGLAAGFRIHSSVLLMAEWFGEAGFSTRSNCTRVAGEVSCTGSSSNDQDAFPMELDVGAQVDLPLGFTLTAGVGAGLLKAVGVPQFRLIGGVRWTPDFRDSDNDGVFDSEDRCPTQPEDRDGFEDSDGCPELDNDNDGILDAQDKCPNEAEDRDDWEDTDGCPEADNDGDGIPDLKDHCPREPETINNFEDTDGCPDVPDRDGDDIGDADDKCPDEAEDRDGFEDADGCPEPDNDGDGIPDDFDECKDEAEDFDKFEDDDGCPEPDNDGDGVLDKNDRCPNEKETINGYKDSDGCPDRGKSHVIIKDNKIVITKTVYFETGKSKIKRRSFSILLEVALTLRANSQIRGIRIGGHTDSSGNAERNRKLSQARAEAVRQFLIDAGIKPSRLVAVGYGPDEPIASNRTRKGRAENRRVEFTILDAGEKKPDAKKPEAAPAQHDDDKDMPGLDE